MMSRRNVAAQLRARAEAVRRNAAAEPIESIRAALLNDADLWERMAAYEENTSRHISADHESAGQSESSEPTT
ncbi:MAG: hypothetical protein KIS73_23400 [Enhydrobacter sp.]|nr:hypothetical protein [Enhydrobacter sp.]